MLQLDTENADRNLTSLVTVLTHTPSTSLPLRCQALVNLGDGTKNLDGTGGDFEVVVTVGGQTVQPSPQTLTFSTAVRASFFTAEFPVPAGAEVVVKVLSPNAGDTDVDVTAYLYDVLGVLASRVQQHQDAARIALRVAGTVYFVATAANGGNDSNDGLTWYTPKLTIKTVVEAMSAGDACVIGPGTFAVGASKITQPTGTKVIGAGLDTTVLDIEIVGGSPSYVPTTNTYTADLTIRNDEAASMVAGVAESKGDAACTGVVFERVKFVGVYDAVYITHSGTIGMTFIDCMFHSQYDCLGCNQMGAASLVEVIRPIALAVSAGSPTSCFKLGLAGAGTLRVVDPYGYAKSTVAGGSGVAAGAENGTMVVLGGYLSGTGVAASYDLYQSGSATVTIAGTQHDRAKTSGTITEAATDLDAQLHATQPNYAPAKAGDEMDIIDAPNATAVTAIKTAMEAAGSSLAQILALLQLGVTTGAVSDASASTTVFVTDLAEASDDHYNGGVIVFTSGALLNQCRRILDYAGDTKTITLESALTEAPADEVTFMILGRIEE